jgi:hypothetical protein
MSLGPPSSGGLPPFDPAKAPQQGGLPAMNAAANANAGGGSCPKQWFGMTISKVDEQNQVSFVADVTVDLQIPDLGVTQRQTGAGNNHPIVIPQLNPGGTGEVLQMKHDTDVYEAIGDFQ